MGIRISILLICIAVGGSAIPALSQVLENRDVSSQADNPVDNARLPYMAKYKTTQVRTLPDGSTIIHESTEVVAVDSQGRRMTAITKTPQPGDEPITHFTIVDPVVHRNISWVSPGTEATVSAIPIGGAYGCSYATLGIGGPTVKTTTEDLGIKTIQGVEARGRRSSKTMSFGPRGKNPTLLNMVELWTATAPGLGGLLVRYMSDDRSSRAKTTRELESFRQSEPARTIFRLPVGYTIVQREVSMLDCPTADETLPLPGPAR
jgi:hypothetical protein